MKKKLSLFLFVLSITIMSACGAKEVSKSEKEPTVTSKEALKEEDSEGQSIEVDKGLANVEITLPASFFEEQDVEEVIAKAKEDGVKDIIVHDDGSLTYKMSKSVYNKMMKDIEVSLLEYIEDIKSNEEYQSIHDITHNKSFTEFTLLVDQEAYENSFDGFVTLGIGLTSMYYQLFAEGSQDSYKTTIFLKNEATGEVFNTVVYPDVLEE